MSWGAKILSSAFYGCGVSILLYGSMPTLQPESYAACVPFWPFFMMPSGMLWKKVRVK